MRPGLAFLRQSCTDIKIPITAAQTLAITIPARITSMNNPAVTSTATATCVTTDTILEVIVTPHTILFTT